MLTDDQVMQICISELDAVDDSSELSNQREAALNAYNGELYGDEVEGRSQVVSREVMEAVEGLMPSLMRIFAEQDNLVEFVPVGPEDEEQAQQETDVINHIFWNENRGFYNLYTFCKDAMLSKTGVLKIWSDKTESVEREEYEGLDDVGLGQLLQDPYAEREVLEYEATEDGHHVIFRTTRDDCEIKIAPIAPEECGVKLTARSPYIADAPFSFCRFKKTIGELLAEGYEKDVLERLSFDEEVDTEERLARDTVDEANFGWSDEFTMREVWVTECYARMDRDEDGVTELLKVTIGGTAGENGNGILLDVEEIDHVPLVTTPAIIMTHEFYGWSIADLVMDIQKIQTTLLRQVLDNTYLANNGMTAVNGDYVNIEDLLTKRPGGLVRYRGDMPWSSVVGPIPHNQLPAQTFETFERMDERQKRRTGYGDEVGALDPNALASVNTGVAALAFDAARARIELLARVIAEIGLKPLFHLAHELMIKNKFKGKALRLRNKWVNIDPSNWKTRKDSKVTVGIGKISKERKIMGYEAILAKQQELVSQGAMGTIIQPWHVYEANKGWIEAWGFEPDMLLQDPRELPPPPPKGPDPQAELAQAQGQAMLMDGQSKMLRAQNEQQKIALDAKRMEMESQYKQAEQFLKAQIEGLKQQQAQMKAEADVTGKVVSMQHESAMKDTANQLDAVKLRLEHLGRERDRDLEWYKAMTTAITTGQMPGEEPEVDEAAEAQQEMERQMQGQRDAMMVQAFNEMRGMLEDIKRSSETPKDVEYDENGLIKAIGGKPVTRDDSGRVRRIG